MAHKTITIMGDPIRKENLASGAITPGHLIERLAATTVRNHTTSGGNAQKMFALEDELQGKEIGEDYATGTRVMFGIFRAGDEVYARIANGQTVAYGNLLESNGDGELKVHVPQTLEDSNPGSNYTQRIIGKALEALDLSGSSGEDPADNLCIVEVM